MSEITTAAFLARGTAEQFSTVLSLYSEALTLKAESKSKPQELIKLDDWYQNKLPALIKAREAPHILHEELVNVTKWKLARGKFRPRLKELVTMNSPRLVMAESKKAFRALFKKGDLNVALAYLCNLKGIGPSTASAILTAGAPHLAAFMADECLAAVPEIEGIDYTVTEYLDLMKVLKQASIRLSTPSSPWPVHRVELALWTHNILLLHKPELLHGVKDEPEVNSGEEEEAPDSVPPPEEAPYSEEPLPTEEILDSEPVSASDEASNSAAEPNSEEETVKEEVAIAVAPVPAPAPEPPTDCENHINGITTTSTEDSDSEETPSKKPRID